MASRAPAMVHLDARPVVEARHERLHDVEHRLRRPRDAHRRERAREVRRRERLAQRLEPPEVARRRTRADTRGAAPPDRTRPARPPRANASRTSAGSDAKSAASACSARWTLRAVLPVVAGRAARGFVGSKPHGRPARRRGPLGMACRARRRRRGPTWAAASPGSRRERPEEHAVDALRAAPAAGVDGALTSACSCATARIGPRTRSKGPTPTSAAYASAARPYTSTGSPIGRRLAL